MTGIRAELVFERTGACPVAAASTATTGPVTDITWTASAGDGVTEQVTVTGEESGDTATDREGVPGQSAGDGPTFERVFDYGPQQVYEFEREQSEPCVCECIEQEVGPLSEVYAAAGALHVTLHVGNVDAVRELLGNLEERFGDVRLEYLVRSRVDSDDADLVPVDLQRLTGRQREVLERAYTLGYFDYPWESNASEVAKSLGIGPSTFIEHLNGGTVEAPLGPAKPELRPGRSGGDTPDRFRPGAREIEVMSLRRAVAAPFRQRGVRQLNENEFVVALSLDREWFSPDQAQRLADVAATEGLVERVESELAVTFDPHDVDIPDEFEPDESILQRRTTFERLLAAVVDAGVEKHDAVGEINQLQAELAVSVEAAAALYGRRQGVEVTDLAARAAEELDG